MQNLVWNNFENCNEISLFIQVPRQGLGSGNSDLGKLVDWHDREAMERDAKREGRGERDPVVLTPEEAKLDKLTKPRFVTVFLC